MPFLAGETKTLPGQPPDIDPLREALANYLQSQIPGGGGGPPTQQGGPGFGNWGRHQKALADYTPSGGAAPGTGIGADIVPNEPSQFFIDSILGPTQEMFAGRRAQALGQAKESAGTLTGSGMAHTLGTTVNRSLTEEQNILAQLINSELGRTQQGNAIQAQLMNQLMIAMSTAGVGPPQNVYQPGFMDYLFQGAGAAAPIIASKTGG